MRMSISNERVFEVYTRLGEVVVSQYIEMAAHQS